MPAMTNDEAMKLIGAFASECDTVRSRLEALLTCTDAIEYLEGEDVFGKNYGELLFADVRALSQLINQARSLTKGVGCDE